MTGTEFLWGVGTIILALAIAWGILRTRGRNRANDPITDAAAKEEYENPRGYDPEKYRAQLHPDRRG